MEKLFIKNRKGLKMAVLIDETDNQKGLVFLMHGFLDFKERKILEKTAKIFKEKDFTVIRFDATSSLGESEGKMEDGTMTGYLEDLEDVLKWAKQKEWYREPFYLVGHSLGGYCIANYAAFNPTDVKGLILFSSVVSGKLFQETDEIRPILKEWKEKGIRVWDSLSSPGITKKSKYIFIEDGMNHDALKFADKIKCSVLMVTGEKDTVVPVEYQKMLFDKINSQKQFYVVMGSDHPLEAVEDLKSLFETINNWIK